MNAKTKNMAGLSPLARGTPFLNSSKLSHSRFIPAGAGNTHISPDLIAEAAFYPRWRGEHFTALLYSPFDIGLSPLARGTLLFFLSLRIKHRFIPAGAGNTTIISPASARDSVYPRWRGEHAAFNSVHIVDAGLSPLARGTPPARSPLHRGRRFIPAGAGNTLNGYNCL